MSSFAALRMTTTGFLRYHWPAGHQSLSMNLTGIVEAQVDAVAAHPHVILSVAKDPGF
jgi:hypothetical protein